MRTAKYWTTRLLSCALIVAMCGLPEVVQAQSAAGATSGEAPPVQDQRAPEDISGSQGTPAQGQPATLPDAPSQEMAQAQPPAAPPNSQAPPTQSPPAQNPGAANQPATPPAMTPAPSQNPAPATPPNSPTPPAQNKPAEEPAGAAAAQSGVTNGGPASKPAGMAIAPAKQRQVRSFLIKMAAIAAGGAAIGTVVALSKASPSKPPGAK